MSIPHPDRAKAIVRCAIVTVSDTRTPESDRSGQLIRTLLEAAGHSIGFYQILPDEPDQIGDLLQTLGQQIDLDAIVFNGGTGIAPRDTTYDAIEHQLEKILPGFGELFRALSFAEIGSRSIASRAVAGVFAGKIVFSVPGSTNAVKLAMERLILPELVHLVGQIQGQRASH